jgi:hypothetical protein
MIPESHEAGELALYRFENFPFGLKKIRIILLGKYADSHLLRHQCHWFLFTTLADEFNIYVAEDFLSGRFYPHPRNPITCDPKLNRSAGAIFRQDGCLYRVAQDCSVDYGMAVNMSEIVELSPVTYDEHMVVEQLLLENASWNMSGTHHFSICQFDGATIVAIDGKQPDYILNRFASIWRILRGGLAGGRGMAL